MAQLEFQGTARALSPQGLGAVADQLGVRAIEIWAILAVETSGSGYLSDRRPQMLFERHVFHRLTGGSFDDGVISDSKPGGYGASGAHQYDRLAAAIRLDRTAALKSASWGIAQIMGNNHAKIGFDDVEAMVVAMTASEDQQLTVLGRFVRRARLTRAIQEHDWTKFARGYNGPNYAINQYDRRLNSEYRKYASAGIPDLSVRAAQLYLTYLGFHPGRIDGIPGVRTLSALTDFQAQSGLPVRPSVDADTISQLLHALDMPSGAAAPGP